VVYLIVYIEEEVLVEFKEYLLYILRIFSLISLKVVIPLVLKLSIILLRVSRKVARKNEPFILLEVNI